MPALNAQQLSRRVWEASEKTKRSFSFCSSYYFLLQLLGKNYINCRQAPVQIGRYHRPEVIARMLAITATPPRLTPTAIHRNKLDIDRWKTSLTFICYYWHDILVTSIVLFTVASPMYLLYFSIDAMVSSSSAGIFHAIDCRISKMAVAKITLQSI